MASVALDEVAPKPRTLIAMFRTFENFMLRLGCSFCASCRLVICASCNCFWVTIVDATGTDCFSAICCWLVAATLLLSGAVTTTSSTLPSTCPPAASWANAPVEKAKPRQRGRLARKARWSDFFFFMISISLRGDRAGVLGFQESMNAKFHRRVISYKVEVICQFIIAGQRIRLILVPPANKQSKIAQVGRKILAALIAAP